MDSESEELYLMKLKQYVYDEDKIVSFNLKLLICFFYSNLLKCMFYIGNSSFTKCET